MTSHVVIIGGGIGGLTLAQGLKRAGISVAVYERDRHVTARLQGYRVHINPEGSRALHACLPPHLFEAFARSCGRPGDGARFLTEHMGRLLAVDGAMLTGVNADPVARHWAASRMTLRRVLLSGLDGIVHFDKTFTRYEERADGRIVAHFEDGSDAEGDILVAADGGGSRVRRQFLPDAARVDTGVAGIAGKVFLDQAGDKLDPQLLGGITLVAARGGLGLFVALQDFWEGVPAGAFGGNDGTVTSSHFDNIRSYLMWALSGDRATLGVDEGDDPAEPALLAYIARRAMRRWAKPLRDLVPLSDPATLSLLPIRTSLPVGPWPTGRVTLIGDAIHSMTPYRGIGANIALKDAVRLRDALVAGLRGERDLIAAIHDYETEMRDYGFRAVENSRRAMRQTVSHNEVARSLSRLAFRVVDRLPPVKRRLAMQMGNE
jgi:2-polyprenyl-6-methoxyphenol hydroxylase-like FAD-dependent oxidoreductase